MPSLGTVSVAVKPDLSAFRQADPEDIVNLLELHLINRLPRNVGRSDLRVVATAMLEQFNILPK